MELENLVFIKTSFAKLVQGLSAECKFSLTNRQIEEGQLAIGKRQLAETKIPVKNTGILIFLIA